MEFVKNIEKYMPAILAIVRHRLSNARIEAINNKIKLIQKTAYGFKNINNLFAMIMVQCGNYDVTLPDR